MMETVIMVIWDSRERSGEFWHVARVDLVDDWVTSRLTGSRFHSISVSSSIIFVFEAF
jgi:hypothetical protein